MNTLYGILFGVLFLISVFNVFISCCALSRVRETSDLDLRFRVDDLERDLRKHKKDIDTLWDNAKFDDRFVTKHTDY